MTQILTQSVLDKSTVNRGVTPANRSSGRLPRVPKFVDHPEIKGRWAYERIFTKAAEPTPHSSAGERELPRFKRMHFCARRMKMLIERHGAGAVRRSDYQRFARLHQQFRDDIAFDNLGLVYSLCRRSRTPHVDSNELLSEGMMALTRAIEKFNPWLGFRFSTYACNVILRAAYRYGQHELKRRDRESVSFENGFEKSDWLDTCRTEESSLYVERLDRILSEKKADLTPIEEHILAQRFSSGSEARQPTLAAIGLKMNLSKERVRQIEKAGLAKLRTALECDSVLNPKPPGIPGDLEGVHLEDSLQC